MLFDMKMEAIAIMGRNQMPYFQSVGFLYRLVILNKYPVKKNAKARKV